MRMNVSIKQLMLAVIFGTIVASIWGNVIWSHTPFPQMVYKNAPNNDATMQMLRETFPESGAYIVPGINDNFSDPEFKEKAALGPRGQIMVELPPANPRMTREIITMWAHTFLTVLILALIMQRVLPALPRFESKLGFGMAVGFFAAFYHLQQAIHFPHSWHHYLMIGADDVALWTLVSMVLAYFLKPRML